MAHVQDRWFKEEINPITGKEKNVRTAHYGKGLRYRVRYLDVSGKERSKSFPDKCKKEADAFCLKIASDMRAGSYIDPEAGKMLLRDYAQNWIKGQAADPNSRDTIRQKVQSRILAYLGDKRLSAVEKPVTVRDWLDWMRTEGVSENYAEQLFRLLSGMLESAVSDKLIHANPCRSKGISRPKNTTVPAVAWENERVMGIRQSIPERERIAVDIGIGLGLRAGEIFGLSPDDIDDGAGVVHVRRQVRKVRGQLVFSLPKRDKLRDVPIAQDQADALRAYLAAFPARTVTLPWKTPGGKPATHTLVLTRPGGTAWHSSAWDYHVWAPAFRQSGTTKRPRIDGLHALRHTYASILLANGVSIRELATYLGHEKLSFTLEIYTHMLPSSHQRAQAAVSGYFRNTLTGPDTSDGLHAA
ncbi:MULTISPECIES: site-specific integrase [unclassified Saccharopolyspora]|uniref:tyrosine-type recombinase/integrase n=1 Tax=unclassified Saccharopolyspora TaxID=2646250 RepID=UPI001CD70C51|nr:MULTISPECIES: site-specific integrase [unclassified Saccharopolyspora]MCA1190077.1 site-specific integrase [Saccharopolyspora sp. 6T]MCA1229458.1 site-specific integrase [Saccharopolyspora sp. 6M]